MTSPCKQVVLSFQGSRNEKPEAKIKKFLDDIRKVTELVCACVNETNNFFIEMNLSCPNEALAPLYKDISGAIEVIQLVDSILLKQNKKIKLIAKIGVLNEKN